MERENPVFKEIVKAGLTPMLSTLAIMENANSESEVLGLGLSVIALNLGMYIGLPAFGILRLYQIRKNYNNFSIRSANELVAISLFRLSIACFLPLSAISFHFGRSGFLRYSSNFS